MSESYLNGYRFGKAYASNYGTQKLLTSIRHPQFAAWTAQGGRTPADARNYHAGMIDAALAVVQGEK
jgi:hypothetical protein